MSNLLLAKPILPHDVQDLSVGEPHVVREILNNVFSILPYEIPQIQNIFEYPNPTGYKPLVKILEEKHQAPVIITNGAKQALGAAFYALKQMSYNKVAMKTPYWALLPPLATMHNLTVVLQEPDVSKPEPYLLLAPNNPDGQCDNGDKLKELSLVYKEAKIPFIHDAAYYTHTYLPCNHLLPPIGDLQIYSVSKWLGLSSLRLGYVVCHNTDYYSYIQQYMEAMTVGVSNISQIYLYDLLNRMRSYPTLSEMFEGISSSAILESKKIFKNVNPKMLIVPDNIENIPGMFGWFKVGPKFDPQKSKIHVISGKYFGDENSVRINLAFNKEKIIDIVKRINQE